MKIEEILAGRTDLSTFLVHLTRGGGGRSAKQNLIKIINEGKLAAGSAQGAAVKQLDDAKQCTDSQKVVCFTETPLEHINLLTNEIDGRTCKFEDYGIAITRKQGRRRDVNPIWYIDITPGRSWLTTPLNNMIATAIGTGNFEASDVSKLTPFIEQMGTWAGNPAEGKKGYRKEFWWEREWRSVGDFSLPPEYMILCPTADFKEIEAEVVKSAAAPNRVAFIDPSWSLEYIIGSLAGFSLSDLGPF